MTSHEVESLFTNIALGETIEVCCDSLHKNQDSLSNISTNQFDKLLIETFESCAQHNSYFLFDGIIYQQVYGVAMGSSLGPSLRDIFLAHYEQIWLNDIPDELTPVYYKGYVDYHPWLG